MKNAKRYGKKIAAALTAAVLAVSGAIPASASYLDSERDALAKLTDTAKEQLSAQKDSSLSGKGGSMNLKLEVGESVSELVGLISGVDLSWLKNIGLTLASAVEDDGCCNALSSLAVNDADIITAEMPIDFANNLIRVRIPQLSESFLSTSLTDTDGNALPFLQDLKDMMNTETLNESLPDSEMMAEILTRYANLILDSMTEGTSYEVNLGTENVAEELTVYEGILSSEGAYQAVQNILTETKSDEQLAQLIEQVNSIAPKQDLYEKFQAKVDDLLANLQESKPEVESEEGDYISSKLMLDKDGKCAGREVTVYDNDDIAMQLSWFDVQQGDASAFHVLYDDGSEIWQLIGEGKTTDGKLNGSYTVDCEGKTLLTIDVTDYTTDTESGSFSGDYKLTYVEPEEETDEPSLLETAVLDVHVDQNLSDDWSGNFTASFTLADELMASLSLQTSSDTSMLPEHTDEGTIYHMDNEDELTTFTDEISKNAEVILDNLKAVGMPEDFLDQVSQAAMSIASGSAVIPDGESAELSAE